MDKEKSAVEQFLGELNGEENKNPFQENPEEPFEEELEVETEEEKPLPFNKDPKIQKFIEKEISRRLESIEPIKERKVEREVSPINDEVTDVLTRLIGNDTSEKVSMIKEFKNILDKGTLRAKEEAIAELESRQQREIEADIEAEKELENAFENIEENFEVDITSNSPLARKTRQEFVTFVEKIAPKDRNGEVIDYPDMNSAWETFSEIKKSNSVPSRAKELSNRSMSRSSETQVESVKKSNWETADAFIESLGK